MNRTVRIATVAALLALAVGVVTSAGAATVHGSASVASIAKKYAKQYAKKYARRGPRGARGPQGPQGNPGATGAQGPAGVAAFHVVSGPEVTMGTTCNSGTDCERVKTATATCPAGEVPTGGGFTTSSINANVSYDERTGRDPQSWGIIAINYASTSETLQAQVTCARGAGISASKMVAKRSIGDVLARTRAKVAAR